MPGNNPEVKTSIDLWWGKLEQEEVKREVRAQLKEERSEARFNWIRNALLKLEAKKSKEDIANLQRQILEEHKVDIKLENNNWVIVINLINNNNHINISVTPDAVPEQQRYNVVESRIVISEDQGPATVQRVAAPQSVRQTTVQWTEDATRVAEWTRQEIPAASVDQTISQQQQRTSVEQQTTSAAQRQETVQAAAQEQTWNSPETTVQTQSVPESPEQRYDELKDILTSLNRELVPDASWNIVLTGAQMQKLNRISLLRAPFFWAWMPKALADALGRSDIITAEDLKNAKTLRAKRREIEQKLKDEKKYNKELGKLLDTYIDYLNKKNSTNYTLNKAAALGKINEELERGTYINQPLAFMPEVSPLILNICQKWNRERLASNKAIQVMNNWKTINVFPEAAGSAWAAAGYLATCWAGWYANIFEKFLTENTKMSQWQARNMINTVGSLWLVAWVVWIGYWLFTEKEWGKRKFSFPSLWKIAAVIWIPMALNYGSQMTTWSSFLENLNKWWTTGEFPWSSPENLTSNEQLVSQQVMWQFVLLWVPKKIIKQYGSFSSGKMTKIDLDWLRTWYLEVLQNDANTTSEQKARIWAQIAAIENISKSDSSKTLLYNYIERLGITESDLNSDPDWYLDSRLWEAAEKYNKIDAYLKDRWLLIDNTKKDKVIDTLFKEKDLKDEVFDKLKEEWCFMPNPDDNRYKEIAKLNVASEKKIKIAEAFASLASEWTKYWQMSLKVDGWKVKLTSKVDIEWAVKENTIDINPDLTIDGFTDAGWQALKFKDEKEWLRTGLLINYIKAKTWNETPEATKRNAPFELSWWLKFRESVQFIKHDEKKTVLSNAPFIGDMASNHPTIEKDKNREFFRDYLNKLWVADHPSS